MNNTHGPTSSSQPNERTPLIPTNRDGSHHIENAGLPEPWVDTFVNRLRGLDTHSIQSIPSASLYPETLLVETSQTAFALIVLLRLGTVLQSNSRKGALEHLVEVWNQEARDASLIQRVNEEAVSRWKSFLASEPSTLEVDNVLWLSFPLNETGRRIRGMFQLCLYAPRFF